MNVINVRNVQQALVEGCHQMTVKGVERPSRNGKVLVMPGVTATEYARPVERVLMDPDRDANPYFHFMEALWMLAGRNDVEWPLIFNSKFGAYSDNGVTFNGAYGYRWRHWFGADQLKTIIRALRMNGECRRQVLAIWDGGRDLGCESKDIPCNLDATFQVAPDGRLDMVVFNRSNDLIWGAYGANAVHFSMLLEYVAAALGREVGTYTQVSSNTHVYEPHWPLMKLLAAQAPMPPSGYRDAYSLGNATTFPMVSIQVPRWERELDTFMKLQHRSEYADPFFQEVAKRLWVSYISFKEQANPHRYRNARAALVGCPAFDWTRACTEWIDRREAAQVRKAEIA